MNSNETQNERQSDSSSATLFHPRLKTLDGADSRVGWSLSPELRRQITRRLRLIAITYSLAFVFADIVPTILFNQLGEWFRNPFLWIPGVGSILAGLAVAGIASSPRLSWQSKLHMGLVFEVLGSYGIALSQYVFPPDVRHEPHVLHV